MEEQTQLDRTTLMELIETQKWVYTNMNYLKDENYGVPEQYAERYQKFQILEDEIEELIISKVNKLTLETFGGL